jgi:hypothetical protein
VPWDWRHRNNARSKEILVATASGFITWRTNDFIRELEWIKAAVGVGFAHPRKPKRRVDVGQLGETELFTAGALLKRARLQ